MEMQEHAAETKRQEDKAAKEPMLEVKGQGNPYTLADNPLSEEVQPSDYIGLQKQSEDIYSNVLEPPKQPAKQPQGSVRTYRVACLILTVLCLVLLLVAIILMIKMKTGSTACPVSPVSWAPPTCNMEQCRAFTSQARDQCYCCHQCPPGWLRLDQSCFFFSTFRLNWEESRRNCLRQGGSLVVVSRHKVQTFLTQNGNGLIYWIGFRKSRGVQWIWVDNTTQEESYWGADLTAGDCAILNSNGFPESNWMMSACGSYTYFICQMNLGIAAQSGASSPSSN
ncbi:CD209 antigen-like protein E [Phyllopteryx taeniolatus]|uniref:CD209 antigen-like protein E n=1 Tax=Phyllopteryx taeniolatus TaxID=161469 RepID=UPI002AD4B90F|nr:CD209 antigen-like protein E [Phyllopteryx taeniolatus]XP_061631878.1 CD209 antigen-like protein E [Phyllopteryx taeniolatus]XP_061631879.1 CD209 antigen-like protein E [Phyllopteryx taeniolatus]